MANRHYIDLNPLLATGAIYLEAWTDRGDGKTSAMVKLAFDSWRESGKTAVILRRWSTEMGTPFQEDILTKLKEFRAEAVQNMELQWSGNFKKGGLYLKDKKQPNARAIFHCFPCSMGMRLKSGMDVKTHKNLYFDEYIPSDSRYCKNEVNTLLNIYRTVDRDTESNYMFLFGNREYGMAATDIYFNIDHDYNKNQLQVYRDGTLAILTYANRGHTNAMQLSKLGKLTAGTDYGEYVRGGVLSPSKPPIFGGRIPAEYVTICTTFNHACRVYIDPAAIVIALRPYSFTIKEPTAEEEAHGIFTIDPMAQSGYAWLRSAAPMLCKLIKYAFENGKVYYDSVRTYETYNDIITYLAKRL